MCLRRGFPSREFAPLMLCRSTFCTLIHLHHLALKLPHAPLRPQFVVLARIIPEFKPLVAHLAQNYHFWTALAWEEAVAQGYKGAKGKEERPSGARPSASGGRTEAPISPEVVAVEEPDRKRASGAGDSAFPRIKEVDQWTVGMTRVGGGVGMPAVDVTGLDMGLLAECVNELGVLGVREVPEAIMSADLRGKVGSFLKKLDL